MSSAQSEYQFEYPKLHLHVSAADINATMVVWNIPTTFLILWKGWVINYLNGHELICSIKPVKDQWYINIEKSASGDFSILLHEKLTSTATKVLF